MPDPDHDDDDRLPTGQPTGQRGMPSDHDPDNCYLCDQFAAANAVIATDLKYRRNAK
jgi:hypothetical protein